MDQEFTLDQARELLPEVREHAEELIAIRADLVELQATLALGGSSDLGGLPEAKGLQARFSDLIGWFPEQGLDLKGIAPLLLDFPAQLDGQPVLLCWLEGEQELCWYHDARYGFAGRRVIPSRAR